MAMGGPDPFLIQPIPTQDESIRVVIPTLPSGKGSQDGKLQDPLTRNGLNPIRKRLEKVLPAQEAMRVDT